MPTWGRGSTRSGWRSGSSSRPGSGARTTFSVRVTGRDAGLIPTDASNLIWQTALAVAGDARCELPNVELDIRNDIPLGKGLGSSAAALTAGVVIADQLLDLHWKPLRILDEAARIEGHPDNVAACVLGSIVASALDSGGAVRAVRLDMPAHFSVAVVVPDFILPTSEARAVLPDTYSRRDAVFNVQRSALFVAALATGRFLRFRLPSRTACISRIARRSCLASRRSRGSGRPVCSGVL